MSASEGANQMPLTGPTLDVSDFVFSDENEEPEAQFNGWGRMWPMNDAFSLVELDKPHITFGRKDGLEVVWNNSTLLNHRCYPTLSQTHFRVIREKSTLGEFTYLLDLSSNGTFVNGEKIGKNKKHQLLNNSRIGLAMKSFDAYVYIEKGSEDSSIPAEIRKRFVVSNLLGRGAMGEVRLAHEKGTCSRYAIKIIQKTRFNGVESQDLAKHAEREGQILRELKHPNIIQIVDVLDLPDCAYVVLELMEGGELFDKIVNNSNPPGRLPERIAKLYCYQILQGIKYLHDNGITHRDLKPENILLASTADETVVKITDFGLSKIVDSMSMLKTLCGTPQYLAPEVLQTNGMGHYTQAVDMWSLGVILFVSLSGYPPFSSDYKDLSLNDQILKGRVVVQQTIWKQISDNAVQLYQKMLTVKPKDRITAEDALKHPWFVEDTEIVAKARALMYPNCNGMIPPDAIAQNRTSPRKRNRAEDTPVDDTMEIAVSKKR